MMRRPKAMFISGLIVGILILALILSIAIWGARTGNAENHWKVETNGSDTNYYFSEDDLATRVAQISAKCRVEVVPGENPIYHMVLSGCP